MEIELENSKRSESSDLSESRVKEWTTINVGPRVDTFTLPTFRKECEQALRSGATKIALDFAGTQFISMLGLHFVYELLQQLKAAKGDLLLVSASEKMKRQMQIYSHKEIRTLFRARKEVDFL